MEVRISFEYNDNRIEITKALASGGGQIEDLVRRLLDEAKAEFIAALNA